MINSINIQIRETNTDDFDSIMTVEKQAFGYDKEAQLVADLLADKTAEPMVSLLAFYKGEAVGHILFTRAYFDGQGALQMMHILAPLAVKPEYQRQGIGGMLIRAGIERLQEKGSCLVFVLGIRILSRIWFYTGCSQAGLSCSLPDTGTVLGLLDGSGNQSEGI